MKWLLRRSPALLLLAVSMLAAASTAGSTARASISIALSMPELVRESDQVIVGTVVREASRYDEHRRIVTDVTIRVEESLKGRSSAGREVVITRLGGEVGDIGMRVEGEATFQVGERAIVFAKRLRRQNILRTVGMSQGVLRIQAVEGTDRVVRDHVMPSIEGLSLVRRNAAGRLVEAAGAITAPRPYADVIQEIRSLIRENGRVRP